MSRLRAALERLNLTLSPEIITAALDELIRDCSAMNLEAHCQAGRHSPSSGLTAIGNARHRPPDNSMKLLSLVALWEEASHAPFVWVVAHMVFSRVRTRSLNEAAACGCRTLDGLGMLVNQGIVGVKYWTGIEPDAAVMRKALEDALGV